MEKDLNSKSLNKLPDQNLIDMIKINWIGSKHIEPDQKMLNWIKMYWTGSKHIKQVQNILNWIKIHWTESKSSGQTDKIEPDSSLNPKSYKESTTDWQRQYKWISNDDF